MSSSLIDALGWSLVHFLWQGAIVAASLWIALRFVVGKPAQVRYGACGAALGLLASCPAITLCVLRLPKQPVPEQTVSVVRSVQPVAGMVAAPTETLSTVVAASPALRSWIPPLVVAWAIGVVLLSMRLLGGIFVVERLRRRFCVPAPPEWQNRLDALARALANGRRVVLAVSHRVDVPSTVGVFRAVVILPASILTKLSPDQVEAILVHELAHVARHDYLVNLLQSLLETVLFYHPAVWWVSHVARIEREHCCDDVVLRAGGGAARYAETLALLEVGRLAPTLSLRATGGRLLNRIRRILGGSSAPARSSSAGAISFLLPGLVAVSMLSAFIVLVGVYRLMQYARWSTDSPKDQAGLRLVALQMDVPRGLEHVNIWPQGFSGPDTQRAWVEILDDRRWNVLRNPAGPYHIPHFRLQGKSGFPMWLGADDQVVQEPGKSPFCAICVHIPPGYGPEYMGCVLQAFDGDKEVAAWRLKGMTPPSKQIDDDEPIVTEAEALGYKLTVSSPVTLRPGRSDAICVMFGELRAHAQVTPIKSGLAESGRLEVEQAVARTTWAREADRGCSLYPIPIRGTRAFDLMGDCYYRASVRRVEFRLTFRRYQILDEPVEFKDVHAEYDPVGPPDLKNPSFQADVKRSQQVVTPSGLTISLPVSSRITSMQPGCVGLRIHCAQGYDNLRLPGSALCRSTGRPVSLSLVMGNGWSLRGWNSPKAGGNWEVLCPVAGPKRTKPWVIPKLSLIVRQKAVLEEKTVNLILPVVVGDWPPKNAASRAHER